MTEKRPPFEKIVIVGIGLIGSSLAHAIKKKKLAKTIIGVDQSPAVQTIARDKKIVDRVETDFSAALPEAELIILAVPMGAMATVLDEIATHAPREAIIMDVGSVKNSLAQLPDLPPLFVPAHPIAGTEHSGPEAGFAELFENRWCILTPLQRDEAAYAEAVTRVENFWQALGSLVTKMAADHHDVALAVTSHLPHLIAFTLVRAAEDMENVHEAELVKYAAGGFRDFTRIAASDPTMWRDVFLHNKEALLEVLSRFSEELAIMQRAIRWGDGETLFKAIEDAKGVRKAIIDAGQETDVPNFGRDQ